MLECQIMARSRGPVSACSNAVSHPEWSSGCAIARIHKTNVFLAHMGASDGLPTQRCFCDDQYIRRSIARIRALFDCPGMLT
ncbi:protein of unknown function [Methylorubrum extorquens]|uniref:Uncharacterized protein n=1 Tax=Methylorubrum extorquens TaxID=408 RepID=A0A2N9ALY0_METEX|nr:protein of unknown function [Methylorubrum extorquens]